MNIEEVREYTLSLHGVTEDQPFGDDIITFRIEGKIFLCLWLGGGEHGFDRLTTNSIKNSDPRFALKLTPERNEELREQYTAVNPAWHWNKKHWSDVYYELLDDKLVQAWIEESYNLVVSKLPKAVRQKYIQKKTDNKKNTIKNNMIEDNNKGQIILYQTEDGQTRLEVQLQGETVWLSLDQMAELFQRNKSTISRHIKNVFEEGELSADSTVAFFATVQNEGKRKVERNVQFFNLDMIISVGYRVHSHRGVQFRIWATQILKEYMIKGFVLNDELLKNAGEGNYFDELLARIRDIRSSEKVFYRKVLAIYATSIDYDPRVETTKLFFKTVQNKMHFSAHGHTAAEVIYERADADKDFMGLTSWTGAIPKRTDAEIAKNYLNDEELDTLNRIVNLYLEFAELQAKSHIPMYMNDWVQKLDDFLRLSNRELLTHAGKISAEVAKQKADLEHQKFQERTKYTLSPVEIHFIDQFEAEQKKLKGN